jgi:hypothetical protein
MRGHRRSRGDWYAGTGEAHLLEHALVASAEDAIAWGRDRTPRVRIRTADARTYWAGTTAAPEGFAHTWTHDAVGVVPPPRAKTTPVAPAPDEAREVGPDVPQLKRAS